MDIKKVLRSNAFLDMAIKNLLWQQESDKLSTSDEEYLKYCQNQLFRNINIKPRKFKNKRSK